VAYLVLKHVHVASAVVSFALFLLRGAWMLTGSRLSGSRISRIAPHVVDTILLASAIGLTVVLRQYPLAQDWLTAKVVALVVYIVLGSIALRRGKTRTKRTAAFVAAIMVFFWIVMTARARAPWLIAT
jgi:uncharacterized membrane protein SirB2